MRKRATAILFSAGRLLVIRRVRPGLIYYVLPGGGLEEGESAEEACRREVLEETGLTVTRLTLKKILDTGNAEEYYYLAETAVGEAALGGPEAARHSPENQYWLEWVAAGSIGELHLLPAAAKSLCMELAGYL